MRKIVFSLLFLLVSLHLLADNPPRPTAIRVNGCEVSKVVTAIDMDEHHLILTWNDHTCLTGQIANLMVDLAHQNINAARLMSVSGIQRDQMTVEGLSPNTPLTVYNILGQRLLSQDNATSAIAVLDLRPLPTGIYLLQCGNAILKFVKR